MDFELQKARDAAHSLARRDWSGLSPQQIQQYHLCTDADLVHAVRRGNVAAFVTQPNADLVHAVRRGNVAAFVTQPNADLVHAVRRGNVTQPNADLGLTPELVQNGWKPIARPPATIWIAPN